MNWYDVWIFFEIIHSSGKVGGSWDEPRVALDRCLLKLGHGYPGVIVLLYLLTYVFETTHDKKKKSQP